MIPREEQCDLCGAQHTMLIVLGACDERRTTGNKAEVALVNLCDECRSDVIVPLLNPLLKRISDGLKRTGPRGKPKQFPPIDGER